MCGIAGALSQSDISEVFLSKMTDVLAHRGPDGEGHWISGDKKVGLGHRRLSIIDLSANGKQPMSYADERYHITYNGEIYNYLELKEELIQKGYQFKSNTDTEVLLALYHDRKEKCLQDLDGMFAFAIWDEVEQELFCARDRFGEKPFYYTRVDDQFLFASEMKALFAVGASKEKDLKKYYYYLLYNVIEDAHNKSSTFYKQISQLEPAHYMIVKEGRIATKKMYWDIDFNEQIDISLDEAKIKFYDLFKESINYRLRSDVPVGSSLSGGLDSSSIVMMINELRGEGQVQKTFSARFKNFERDEGEYMQSVIDRVKVEPHFIYPTGESAWNNLEKIMYHQEEPIGSLSIAVQYEVMKSARQNNVPVLLDGQGADEILAGYWVFFNSYFLELYKNDRKRYNKELEAFESLHDQNVSHGLDFKVQAMRRGIFEKMSEVRKNSRSSKSDYFLGIHPDLVEQFKKESNPIIKPNSLKEHLYFFTMKRGLDELLRYADRNSMAHSVEVRLPFLSHKLVEFVFSLPSDLLIRSGWTKYILRKSMEDILPSTITWRKDKVGYEPPQKKWENTDVFKTKIDESIELLKKENILQTPNESQNWQYLALSLMDK